MISGPIPLVFFQASVIFSDSFHQQDDKDYRYIIHKRFPFINPEFRLVLIYQSLVK